MNKYIIVLLFIGVFQAGYSQDKAKQNIIKKKEFALNSSFTTPSIKLEVVGGYGFNFPNTAPDSFKKNIGSSYSLGVNYKYELNTDWSLLAGLEFAKTTTILRANDYSGSGDYIDSEAEAFIFKYAVNRYRESWKQSYLGIPIMVEYSKILEGKMYARAGFKYSFGMSKKVDTEASNLVTSGYFPQYNQEFFNPGFAGFGTYPLTESKQDVSNKGKFSFLLEVGSKIDLQGGDALQIAIYYDLGLTNEAKMSKNEQDVISYRPILQDAIQLNSIYDTQKAKSLKTSSLGIRMSYSFDL